MKNNNDNKTGRHSDLYESADDKKHLQPDKAILDLPDAEDIPGQQHIHVPAMTEFADTTISSDDEEGTGIFDDEDDENVTPLEKQLLRKSAEENPDDEDRKDVLETALDNTDNDGDPLNEASLRNDREGEDLDLPEAEETPEEETANE